VSVLSLLRSITRPGRDVGGALEANRTLVPVATPSAIAFVPFTDLVWDPSARN
jgi:hypothetical protein